MNACTYTPGVPDAKGALRGLLSGCEDSLSQNHLSRNGLRFVEHTETTRQERRHMFRERERESGSMFGDTSV